jgi:hypothetical protein
MMTKQPPAQKPLGQVQLGVALTTIYTCPSDPPNILARVSCIWVCNTDAAGRAVSLRVGSGSLTIANALGDSWAVPSKTSFIIGGSDMQIVTMTAGQVLQGLADSANVVTVSVYGDEVR